MYFGTTLMGYLYPCVSFPKRIHNCDSVSSNSSIIQFDIYNLYFANQIVNYCPFCGLNLNEIKIKFNKKEDEIIIR